jgi:dTDP-4-dehydrorhamnose reductase
MNFLMQYLRQLELWREGKRPAPFRVPADQISTPTYAPALAEASCLLREKRQGGIVHYAGSDLLSRRELVERVIAAFGFPREESLRGFSFLPTRALGQAARRPLSAGLRTEKARALGCRALSLAEAFADVRRLQGVR